jgi:hypothetical protein
MLLIIFASLLCVWHTTNLTGKRATINR